MYTVGPINYAPSEKKRWSVHVRFFRVDFIFMQGTLRRSTYASGKTLDRGCYYFGAVADTRSYPLDRTASLPL